MTTLWVLLGITAFFVLLFALRFGIDLNFDLAASPRFVIRIGVGGIFGEIYPRKKRKPLKKAEKRKKWRLFHRKKPKKQEETTEKAPPAPLSEKLKQLSALLKAVRRAAHPLCKAIHLSIDAAVVAASDDAYNTAMEYGAVCAAMSMLTPTLYQVFSVHDCSIRVDADFSQPKFYARGQIRVTTTIGGLLGAGLVFLFTYLRVRPKRKRKISNRKDNNYERASDQRHDGVEFGQNS
ncbi:MAG: DUF2953 domain-containing protein [Clostridiaceae bacterium]|nr:DUF2953 domain-containing protein [Clostridiaceae bacterium]